MNGVAEAIDRNLDLDVAVLFEELLQVERVVAEARLCLRATDLESGLELTRVPNEAHALPAPAGRRLEQTRLPDPLGLIDGMVFVAQHRGAGDRRQAICAEKTASGLFRGEALQHLGRRTDEGQIVGTHDVGETLVLGQEAVSGMDGIAAGDDRGREDGRSRKVAVFGVCRADADGLVGELRGQTFAVGLAVGDDGAYSEASAGTQNSQRNFAAVGDQDLAEHQPFPAAPAGSRSGRPASPPAERSGSSMRTSSCPYSTASPDSARLEPMTPSTGETTSWLTPRTFTWPIRSPDRTRIPTARSLRG